ncbi:MAG: type II secretion system minor pseudopilin GspK [Thermodesulfovibrionia bacterium]
MKNKTRKKLSNPRPELGSKAGNCQLLIVSQRGSALIITLLIVTILISLTVEFAHEVYISSSSLSNWSNAQKASLIAKSGQTLSTSYLRDIISLPYSYSDNIYLPVEKDFGPDTILTIKIEDESSKFNINSIIYQNGLTNDKALSSLKKLFEYLNINLNLALAIADWIDPDHEPRLRDSELNAKNTYLWSVDELRLIEGIEKETLEIIRPFITVHGEGSNRININTAKLPVLVSLHDDMTETLAERIIYYRESTPFENTAHVQRVSGMETIGQSLIGRIDVKSSNFRVISTATVNEITRITESVMDSALKVQYWREG